MQQPYYIDNQTNYSDWYPDYPDKEAVYDMLLGIYEEQSNYERIDALLNDCEISRIVAKYNKYDQTWFSITTTFRIYNWTFWCCQIDIVMLGFYIALNPITVYK